MESFKRYLWHLFLYSLLTLTTLTMSSELYSKIYNFLVTANQEHITATSVIYQGIEEDPWILQNDLRRVVDQAIGFASNLYAEEPSRQLKLLRILPQVSYKALLIFLFH
jgi:hypothetical protein